MRKREEIASIIQYLPEYVLDRVVTIGQALREIEEYRRTALEAPVRGDQSSQEPPGA